jgi:uncharacterized membrane protein (DUF4010 family)
MDLQIAQQLIVSLGLGMLIGLQRERSGSTVAGIRTFPLITLFGTISGQLAQTYGGGIIAAGLVALAALSFVPNLPKLKAGEISGMTTEVAMLLLYGLGAFIVTGPMVLVVATGGAVALLLHWKESLHRFARAIGEADMQAIMRFVLISMVILPVLPNQDYGPFAVFNPFEIWLMVVLIVGMSLCGYVAYKLFGARGGVLLAGLLGGLISSTATTVSASRRVKQSTAGAALAAVIIMLASVMAQLRIIAEVGLVAPRSFAALAPPLAAMLAAMVVVGAAAYFLTPKSRSDLPAQGNPAELKPALIFAIIYALIKLGVAASREHFGSSGLYIIAVMSGLADMDAITLSTSRLVDSQGLDSDTGWRMILIASMSNLLFKGGTVAVLGGAALFRKVAVLFGASLAAGAAVLILWP